MDRHTLHDAATNAAPQTPSSHSYSAWRTSQQTQPRILQYNPPQQTTPQPQPQPQQTQQTQPSPVFSNQTGTGAGAGTTNAISADLKSNIIFTSPERLAQQYIQTSAPQTQFSPLPDETSNPPSTDPNLTQPSESSVNKAETPQTTSGGRVLASSKRAAQNRAAQRAFRQRKERYIKSLEQKATEYDLSSGIIQDLRKENIYLRDYVVRLQNEVDTLNTEMGRAPMFAAAASTQRNPQATSSQAGSLSVSLSQPYPVPIDPQTAAVAAAAAANVHSQQENQTTLTRLAPADATHNAISMPPTTDQPIVESKPEETLTSTTKKPSSRSRKRKNDVQPEGL